MKGLDNSPPAASGDPTWDDLCAIEKRRRDVLEYAKHGHIYQVLVHWQGSVLQVLAFDPLVWLSILVYVTVRIIIRTAVFDLSDYGVANIGVIGGFLTFFLIFFVNDAQSGYDRMYNTSMNCGSRIHDCAILARTTLPRDRALRLIRYINAVHVAAYVGLSGTYQFDNFFAEINRTRCLLTAPEVARMRRMDMEARGYASRELIAWCLKEISDAQADGLIRRRLALHFRTEILGLRGLIGEMYDYDDQPVCFFYVHFVCLLTVLYLPLFALTAGIQAGIGDNTHMVNDILQGVIVFFQGVEICGLRILAVKMSSPYGDDVQDLSVMTYCQDAWEASRRLVNAHLPAKTGLQEEEELAAGSEDIGKAYAGFGGGSSANGAGPPAITRINSIN